MPKFTHAVTGVTVSVDDDTAANLDASAWTPAKEAPKTTRKTSTSTEK